MNELTPEQIMKYTTLVEAVNAKYLYDKFREFEKRDRTIRYICGYIYKAGIIAGKREERAKRKGGNGRIEVIEP